MRVTVKSELTRQQCRQGGHKTHHGTGKTALNRHGARLSGIGLRLSGMRFHKAQGSDLNIRTERRIGRHQLNTRTQLTQRLNHERRIARMQRRTQIRGGISQSSKQQITVRERLRTRNMHQRVLASGFAGGGCQGSGPITGGNLHCCVAHTSSSGSNHGEGADSETLRRLMSTPILPVEGLRAAEGSSDEIGSANQTTRTRQREPINTRKGGAPLLVHRLHSSSDVYTPSGATA